MSDPKAKSSQLVVKVGMVGDSAVGKTSMMVKYVQGIMNPDYVETLGVNFMQRTVTVKGNVVRLTLFDLGGQSEYLDMLPLVCNEAAAVLFMFDLTRRATLTSVKDWYRQVRALNSTAIPILVGNKYDLYCRLADEERGEIFSQAKRYSKAIKAPLIFCSAHRSVNVKKLFKIILSKVFNLKCKVPQQDGVTIPVIIY